MKIISLLALMAAGLVSRAVAADAAPTDAVVIDHTKVDAAFAKSLPPLLVTPGYKVQTGRRVVPGKVEIHASDTDIFYVTEGTATLVTGGTAVDAKVTKPGETIAEKIDGGTPHKLAKGDVVVIPAGVPHWFSEVSGTFLYFVVKVTK